MRTPEKVRSRARRRAGQRIERSHPLLAAKLKQLYNDDKKLLLMYGDHFNARRSEWVRADIADKYRPEYRQYLREEIYDALRLEQ